MELRIPAGLAASCRKTPERAAWLGRLPDALRNLEHKWSLTLSTPLDDEEVSCSYMTAAVRVDETPAVLKIGVPHMEGEHEIQGLRFWDGDPTVRLLMADDGERVPSLRNRCGSEQWNKAAIKPAVSQGSARKAGVARCVSCGGEREGVTRTCRNEADRIWELSHGGHGNWPETAIWDTTVRFLVDRRQLFPWAYFRVARDKPPIVLPGSLLV